MSKYSLPLGCPAYSIWGVVQHGTQFGDNIFFVSTASHGGFKLIAKDNKKIPLPFRKPGGWYEEDCDASVVTWFFPELFTPEETAKARASIRSWNWKAWEEHYNEEVPLVESPRKAEELFIAEHKESLIVVCAKGDWALGVPKGFVGLVATKGGSREPDAVEQYFLVSNAEYKTREQNPGGIFIIDTTTAQAWDWPT